MALLGARSGSSRSVPLVQGFSDQAFGEALQALLSERSMSLRALGARAGVDHAHLSRVVHGKKRVSVELLARIADALEVPPDTFREYRKAVVDAALDADPALLNRQYRRLADRVADANPQRDRRL